MKRFLIAGLILGSGAVILFAIWWLHWPVYYSKVLDLQFNHPRLWDIREYSYTDDRDPSFIGRIYARTGNEVLFTVMAEKLSTRTAMPIGVGIGSTTLSGMPAAVTMTATGDVEYVHIQAMAHDHVFTVSIPHNARDDAYWPVSYPYSRVLQTLKF